MIATVLRRRLVLCLISALVVLLSACGDGSAAPPATTPPVVVPPVVTPPATVAVASVSLSPAGCTLNPAGTCVLTATTRDAAANALTGRTVAWSSATPAVATVSAAGVVTAVAAGSSLITATSEGKSASVSVTTVSTAGSTVVVSVDAAATGGAIADLFGANRKPRAVPQSGGTTWDGAALYQAFGISQVRLHDSGLDICGAYLRATKVNVNTPAQAITGCSLAGSGGLPHFKWTPSSVADSALNNTANYDFTDVDEAVSTALAAGGKIYLRLGEGFNGPNDTDDPVAYAKVATNVYKHVIGQFKASAVTADPAFVEVMNEPDGGSWQGAVSTFDSLFVQTVTRVRAAAAAAGKSVIIGGAGFTTNVLNKAALPTNVANGFVAAVGVTNLDFYSAHQYGSCAATTLAAPAGFFRSLRALVDGQGLAGKPLHITEWNIGLGSQCGDAQYADQRMESYVSAVLTLMQDPAQNIRAAHIYSGMPIMSLFDFTSVSGKVRVNPGAWAFWAHTRLKGATMVSAQVCPSGTGCVNGYAAETKALQALAATAAGVRNVVITNDGAASVTYTVRISGLSGSTVTATIFTPPLLTQDLTLSGSPAKPDAAAIAALLALPQAEVRSALGVNGGQIEMTLTIAARTVQVIEVR